MSINGSPEIVIHSGPARDFELSSTASFGGSGHGHSHGGSGHGHGHGEKKKKEGHSHGHSHGHGHGHGHGKKKKKEGHGHGHKDDHDDHKGHGHSHSKKKSSEETVLQLYGGRALGDDGFDEEERLVAAQRRQRRGASCDQKIFSFWYVGIMTLIYCIAELAAGGAFSSLTLLSDGFHNLSDVVSLVIANWAAQAAKRPQSDEMSFGWARTEILGGLINGTFLLALCLYTGLEAIFRFVYPEPVGDITAFLGVAAAGVTVNLIGTIIFCVTGSGHTHAGGGGGGHSHAHGGSHSHSHGGSHGHGSHSDDDDDDDHDEHDDHDDHDDHHGHSHGSHGHAHGDHGKGKKKTKKKKVRDENVYAVFLHYLGDFVSSILVLITGVLIYVFDGAQWTEYLDPIASLLIVGLILYTTMPLVKRCGWILLQSAPKNISTDRLKADVLSIDGVVSVHDLHIWQLVDGMVLCSAHVQVEEGLDWTFVSTSIREALHKSGVHSSTLQPEFVQSALEAAPFCEQNCVDDCEEDWCCKKTADEHQAEMRFRKSISNSYGGV